MLQIKFLIDECIGLPVAHWLQHRGYDVVSVLETMPAAKDHKILEKAYAENRILITSDKDFGDLVFINKNLHCGIILLRLNSAKSSYRIKILDNFFNTHDDDLSDNFIVISETNIRIIKQDFH